MTQVDISINGRSYAIACDDGQEAHVARLARYLDQKVSTLAKSVGQVGDARLLVMASLQIVDELVETDQALKQARIAPGSSGAHSSLIAPALVPADEGVVAETIDHLARRIEAIAAQLETE